MTEPAVLTRGLTRTFGERRALDGVDLSVASGTIFGLLGPNGGGKSTLFRILSTLLAPTAGTAEVCGDDVVRAPARVRRSIGVVFQSPSLDRKLRVVENLRHQGHLYGLRGAALARRIDELLARFGLKDRARDIVAELSGGLQRRVEIAKGLLHEPRVLLLDEPSTGLDPGARRDLWRQLEGVRDADGTTVLLTTHILEEADGCDQIAILDHGACIALGTPSALKAEIPGDVVAVEARGLKALKPELEAALGVSAQLAGGVLRFETRDGDTLAGAVRSRFGDRIDALTIGRPSLEDVFLTRTGHVFEE